jgi:hypothetical protein
MTLGTYADLFDEDLDGVADRLNVAIQTTADGECSLAGAIRPDLFKLCGAKGNRTPDLLDANETRYQLRYSP